MARHRSPRGRRPTPGSPLAVALAAAAGSGGAHRSQSVALTRPFSPSWAVATVVAGGVVAAAGQAALERTLPLATDGANLLRLSVERALGARPGDEQAAVGAAETSTTSAPRPTSAAKTAAPLRVALQPVPAAPATGDAVPAEPVVATAQNLVKAAELQRRIAEAEAWAASAERAAAAARQAEAARATASAARVTAASTTRATAAAASSGVRLVQGRVTSGFGPRWGSRHNGLDIAAPIGTPIRAPLAGTVISSGPASGFGMWVRIRHDDGTITVYGHINRSLVRVGQRVNAGDVIAEVGNRGQSTGPHLHIEVITPNGTKIDPRPWLDARGIRYT